MIDRLDSGRKPLYLSVSSVVFRYLIQVLKANSYFCYTEYGDHEGDED